MKQNFQEKGGKRTWIPAFAGMTGAVIVIIPIFFALALRPASGDSAPVVFEIQRGESFRDIMRGLSAARLVRSGLAAELLALVSGEAFHLKPGLYQLNPAMPSSAILAELASEGGQAITVTIPEGKNIFEVDAILANALVIRPGDLVRYNREQRTENREQATLEGRLFPDTYQFARGSGVQEVVQKFLDNFQAKAVPLLGDNSSTAEKTLIIASILEKEVSGQDDREVVAGILQKRLAAGMPLDIDATVCYGKLVASSQQLAARGSLTTGYQMLTTPCAPLDFKTDSPYNTYLYKGLPPNPIGNPGISAISAAMHPKSSPYWYYLSDPKTGKTVFAETLEEQNENVAVYLH